MSLSRYAHQIPAEELSQHEYGTERHDLLEEHLKNLAKDQARAGSPTPGAAPPTGPFPGAAVVTERSVGAICGGTSDFDFLFTQIASLSAQAIGGQAVIGNGAAAAATLTISRLAQATPANGIYLGVVAAADTAMTASTEQRDVVFDFSAIRQFATGAIGTQRAFHVIGPTYSFVGASTITNAITLHVSAPIAGTNATITNDLALWTQGATAFGPSTIFPGSTGTFYSFGVGPLVTPTVPGTFSITGPAHTACTASTELTDVVIALARTLQFATGALTLQRAMQITAPTYGFVGASTITQAATLAIGNSPTAGTNATITDGYALLVQAGRAAFGGALVGNLTGLPLGVTTLNFASDANKTDGTASQFSNPILLVTSGVSLGATRNLVLPTNPPTGAVYWVINNTTGAQSIQIIGQSGTGITIATAKRALTFFDGVNFQRLTGDQ